MFHHLVVEENHLAWKTIFRWGSLALAMVALFVVCFYVLEDVRGRRAWRTAEQAITARGESLNWDDYIPPPVPDAQNFYKAPLMAEWFVKSTNSAARLCDQLHNPESETNAITLLSASNYLAWSAAFEPQFRQMRDALQRPQARIDGDYATVACLPIPALVTYREACRVLAHQAKCQLWLGHPDQARDRLDLLYRLDRTLIANDRPPFVIAAVLHAAIAGLYTEGVACGIQLHAWRDSDLAALQKQLAEVHMLPMLVAAMEGERAEQCRRFDQYTMSDLIGAAGPGVSGSSLDLWLLTPRGWMDQNKAVVVMVEEPMIGCVNLTNQTVSPALAKPAKAAMRQLFRRVTPYNFLAACTVANFTAAAETGARYQTWVDQAQIACALERYRIAHGSYPNALASLAPQFLESMPHDVITGKPMIYALNDPDHYLLYSVGWNETDDGGIIIYDAEGRVDRDNGDWVWEYPPEP